MSKMITMRRMRAILTIAAVSYVMTLAAGCASTDVIAKYAVTSFDALVKADAAAVADDGTGKGWVLTSPGGEQFVWSRDFSAQDTPDLQLVFDAQPFLEAGLDPTGLPAETHVYDEASNQLTVFAELGSDAFDASGETTPLSTFEQIVKTYRASIGYHEALDHYGIALGGGNMFEWAKDLSTNDKDIVFVLNPQPFLDAGVDVVRIQGWVFAQVEVMDADGRKELVDKFLMPYDLK